MGRHGLWNEWIAKGRLVWLGWVEVRENGRCRVPEAYVDD